MAYCETDDVRMVLVGVRGQEENLNANSLDEDQLESAITDADVQIDGVLSKRYVTPVTIVPAIIHTLSVNISVYNAYLIYRQDREFISPLTAVIMRYQRALSILHQIDKGDIILDIDTLAIFNDGDNSTVFNPYDRPLFPSSNIFNAPEGFIPPDWVWR